MPTYLRPEAIEEALEALVAAPRTVLAGGTDYYPARVGKPCDEDILDISALARADLPAWFAGLQLAAREVGGEQIQNAGTVGGNLCNASPAADGVPPLLAIDALVELTSVESVQRLPLSEFILGNRRTARRPDQLLTAVLVPKPRAARAGSHFLKLGARRYLVISIVMAAASLEVGADGRVATARIAVGACAPLAKRLPEAEQALNGAPLDSRLGARVQPEHLADLAPIDDVRASAAYRSDVALTLVRRTLNELAAKL